MASDQILQRHFVAFHFLLDSLLFVAGFFAAATLRFGDEAVGLSFLLWLSVFVGALVFSAAIWIAGLYSIRSASRGAGARSGFVFAGCMLAMLVTIGSEYVISARSMGRGVMIFALMITFLLALGHHLWLPRVLRAMRE